MKIAIIHNQFSRGGGMEAYMLLLVKGFLATGDEVAIHTYEVDRQLAAQFSCAIHEMKLPPLPGLWKKYIFLHRCNSEFHRKEYDISLSLTRTSCQDISVCGGVHPDMVKRVKRTSLLRWLYDKIEMAFEQKYLTSVPIIMAHSQAVAREITSNYEVDANKIVLLYPPIDVEKFIPSSPRLIAETRTRFHIADDRLTFLFPSCGHACKGLEQLIQAFEMLDPQRYELLVAGSALPRKIPVNIRHIGYIANLAPVYSAVDYTLLPSHYEAFGLVIPESLQCGTPVITTRNAGAAELLSPEDGIILDNNKPETIAAAIRQLGKALPVAPDFAGRHRLTISQHIADIKALYPAFHSR
jgi:glycosyltransferase involved in cell wall biosynthesis